MFGRDSNSGVGDINSDVKLPGTDADIDGSALRRVLYGVVQKIAKSLRCPLGVMTNRFLAAAVDIDLDLFSVCHSRNAADRLGDRVVETGVFHV